jgi:hypothetical protein
VGESKSDESEPLVVVRRRRRARRAARTRAALEVTSLAEEREKLVDTAREEEEAAGELTALKSEGSRRWPLPSMRPRGCCTPAWSEERTGRVLVGEVLLICQSK